ncbi:MAG: HAD family hydrolase [Candidatus Delongbacteria bacterium]|nr:HAD family hydrolase [Candidatus Delongbacteria bacterium]
MKIKAVTLDFWDTIVFYPFTEEVFMERVEHAFGIFKNYDMSFETSTMLMRSIYERFEDIWHNEKRTPTTPESFKFVEKIIGYEFEREHFDELVSFNEKLITEKYFNLSGEISESIIKLSKKYKLIIISDTGFEPGREIRNALEKYNLLDCFHYGVFSDETGYSKPDRRAFEKASELAGCDFSEMIHIGDRESKDILGAKSVGMSAILFTGFRGDDRSDTTADFIAETWNDIVKILL